MMTRLLRILLVEDQTIVREALAGWIASTAGFALAGSVGTLAAARAGRWRPASRPVAERCQPKSSTTTHRQEL